MVLVVGLGNAGWVYTGTRHNVGFRVVEEVAKRQGIRFLRRPGFAVSREWQASGRAAVLAKPLTCMNLSGGVVRGLLREYGVPAESLLVVHDDLDIPVGRVRIRRAGGDGGHRGVRSIIQSLGTQGFARLKVGIGRPPEERGAVAHVLGGFSRKEWVSVRSAIATAAEAVEVVVAEGIEAAMNRFN